MSLHQTVELAIKDKAPGLFKELKAKGELNQYVAELASEISSMTVDETMAQRRREKWDKLGTFECAARMKMAAALNREKAMATVLEFPQDDTDENDIENDPAFREMFGLPPKSESLAPARGEPILGDCKREELFSDLPGKSTEPVATASEMTTDPAMTLNLLAGDANDVASKTIVVMVDDNFHYMDESARWELGCFATLESAIEACKRVVDLCLEEYFEPGISAEMLLSQYKDFGDDPFIVGAGDGVKFSAWDYAARRCQVITGTAGAER